MVKESQASGIIPITRHHETVAYVVSKDRMEAITETMELLADPEAMQQIRAYEEGRLRFRSVDVLDHEG